MELYLAVDAPLDLEAAPSGASIDLAIGEPVVHVDVVYTDESYTISREATEGLFADLMPLYLPSLTGAIASIPLPEFEDFSLASVESAMTGGSTPEAFWTMTGELTD